MPAPPLPAKCHSIGHDPLRKAKYRFIDSRPPPFLKAFLMEVIQVVLLPSFLPSFLRPRRNVASNVIDFMIIRLWLQDRLWSRVDPDSFFFFFERLNSRFRTWITAEWPDTWPMWVTLMDWSLRDSWSRNYRISLRFSNHFCWNWIEIVHIFCGIWIDCLSTLFFFFF